MVNLILLLPNRELKEMEVESLSKIFSESLKRQCESYVLYSSSGIGTFCLTGYPFSSYKVLQRDKKEVINPNTIEMKKKYLEMGNSL